MTTWDITFATWNALTGIVTTVFAGIAAWAAASGLKTWKSQRDGQYHLELSRTCLKSVTSYVRTLNEVRAPFLHSEESSELGRTEISKYVSSDVDRLLELRFSRLRGPSADFEAAADEAEFVWGNEAKKHFDAVRTHEETLRMMAEAVVKLAKRRESGDETLKPGTLLAITFWTEREGDPFRRNLSNSTSYLRKFLRTKMGQTP